MQCVSSYAVEIKKKNIPIRQTLKIYRAAVSYLIRVYGESWEELSGIVNVKKRFNAAEHLVHGTKNNRARYDFEFLFQFILRKAPVPNAVIRRSGPHRTRKRFIL